MSSIPDFFFSRVDSPSGLRPPLRGSSITLRHTTFGRTPLDQSSVRCRDFYLTKYNTHTTKMHFIQINQPMKCNSFTSLLLDLYVWLSMFRAPLRPSLGAYNCTRSLWFYRWRVAVGALLVVVCQTTTNNAATTTLQR